MKRLKKSSVHVYLVLLSVFSSSICLAQPCGTLNNFSVPILTGPSQAPNTWYPDRYAPAGFSSPSTDLGANGTLKQTISTADAAINRPGGQQTAFYNTQGRRIDLIDGVQSAEIKLYVPSNWATSNKRMAGFWADAKDAGNASAAFAIVEFMSGTDADGMGPRFRGWEDGSGTWINLGLPAGFVYDSWVTIRIAKSTLSSGQFTYTIGNISYTTTSVTASSVKFGGAILQGHNYAPLQPLDATNTGVNYDIYWDDFAQSTKTDALDNLTIKNANTNYYFCNIQSAISDATTLPGHTINVASGTYNEQVLVNKGVRILGTGTTKPVIGFTGTVSGKPTLFDVSVADVTLENLRMNVDLVKLSSAVIVTGSNVNNLAIKNDSINPTGSSAAGSSGSYGNRNAVSINYGEIYRQAAAGVNGVMFTGNVITGLAADAFGTARYFRAGVSADVVGGTFSNNTILSISQDIQVRFASNGDVNITNNNINGGGAEVSSPDGGAGNINITGNTFDGTFGNTYSSSLRLSTNYNSKTTTVQNNVFKNHTWGISLQSFNAITIDNNTFTPLANSTNYRHITENTKEISSTSGFSQPVVGGTFTNNVFNGSGTKGGTGIVFYNHDNDNPIFQPFNIGTAGNENSFNIGIDTFIRLDNHVGPTGTGTSPNIVPAAGFPEYAGNIAITNMACWTPNIDIVNNKFNVGAGLQLPAAMSIIQRDTLGNYLFDKADASCTGILAFYYPVTNYTQASAKYPTIQSAIDAANPNDSLIVEAGDYFEQLSFNKSLSLSGAGVNMCGTGTRPANESRLIAPNTGNLLNLSGAVTIKFDGFEIDSANVANVTAANQNLEIKNSVFKLNFKPSSNNLYFSANTLTLTCNAFKAIRGTNDGSATHLFFAGNAFNATNNSFTSVDAISSMNATTTSLPVWINLTTNANNVNIQYNQFSKIDLGILIADNAGNVKIWNNEFSDAKRETLPFGIGMGAGIALFQNLNPAAPISIKNNKFFNSEDGIRTSGNGTAFPSAKLLSITYNSFESMSDKAIRLNGTYSGSGNKLNATCNWYGNITGPIIATNTGANSGATQILDGGGAVTYKNWLNYGTDANPGLLGFQLPSSLSVAPGNNISQAENHYRVLSNAIGCAVDGQTLTLANTFNFSDAIAKTEWSKGNNGLYDNVGTVTGAGGDDYTITAPDSASHITLTAASLGAATILSPGDVDTVSLETPLFFDSRSTSSNHKIWTISNLIFDGFDASIFADNNGGNVSVMDSLTITNNRFNIPADWNATVQPKDNFQNIGINLNFGKAQIVSNNTFYVDGTGVSANPTYSSTVVLQSTTSGSNVYDGLKITNNNIHVTGLPNANPAKIIGIWENSNNQTAAIEVSANTFVNDAAGNLPANNLQLAIRNTSFSGDAMHQVVYKNNEITGFNRGISFIGDPISSYGANPYFAGENPVIIINNKIDNYNVAVSIKKDPTSTNTGSPAVVNNNSFTHVINGGFAISNESTGITAATCNWYDTTLVANILNGGITYLPRLSNGIDADVATGFQVDPSNTCVSPVLNVNTGNTYITIQSAIDDPTTLNGHSIQVSPGIYPENVTVNKSLNIFGTDSALVIVDKGNANYTGAGGNGFAVTVSNVTLSKMKVRNFANGVNVTAAVSNLLLDSLSLIENFDNGFFSNKAIDSLVIKKSTLSWNGNKNGVLATASSFRRGIMTQASDAAGARFYFLNNVTEYNGLVGIDVNLNKSLNGLVVDGNISRYNADEQIGAYLANSDATMRPISIANNTLVLSGSSRFGLEVKLPHGSGLAYGTGSVVVSNNNVSVAAGHLGSNRDMAAIAVIRRKTGASTPSAAANDQPQGVVITGNTINNFTNVATMGSGSAFGIVVGGIGHKIFNNTINNSQISIQLQKGNENSGNDNDAPTPSTGGNNEYFDRDNSNDACAEIGVNTITASSAPRIVTAPTTTSTPPVQYVTNQTTTVKFCTIQTAIDFPTTANGNTIDAAANTYAENVTVNKSLMVQGPNQANNPNIIGSRVAEAIVIPATNDVANGRVFNVTANNVTIKGFTVNGVNAALSGGTTVNGVSANAADGIATGLSGTTDGNSGLVIENNILQNFSNSVAPNYGSAIYANGSAAAISGGKIRNNKIDNANFWGIYTQNNFYGDIQNNVITRTNRGIQVENYYVTNGAMPTLVSGNTIRYYKRGITMNLLYSNATPYTVSSNTIMPETSGTNEDGNLGAIATNKGIVLWSYSGANNSITDLMDNKITGANTGIEFWGTMAGRATSTGDSVINSTDAGILVTTTSNYGSAASGSFATVTKATVLNATNDGVRIIDNDGVNGTSSQLNLTNSYVIGGANNIAITGPEIDATTAINSNSLTGAGNKSIIAASYTGAAINASCNWYGASSAGYISSRVVGNVTYAPALTSGVDGDLVAKGFQPSGTCAAPSKVLYVNDGISDGSDIYTNAPGNDANFGTPASPLRTIAYAASIAQAGDTIYVDGGKYIENDTLNRPITIYGTNKGISANGSGARIAESTIQTNGNKNAVITLAASNIKIDGLTIDGYDQTTTPNLLLSSGDYTNVSYGIVTKSGSTVTNDTVSNNIIKRVSIGFRGDNLSTRNVITRNLFDAIGRYDFGYAITLRTNFYADVTDNKMTHVWTGLHVNNHYGTGGPATWTMSGNEIHSYAAGLCYWLNYNTATGLIIDHNQFSEEGAAAAGTWSADPATTPSVVPNNFGILVVTLQDAVNATITNNKVTGTDYGVGLTNIPTTSTLTLVATDTITGTNKAAVLLSNKLVNPVGTTSFGIGSASTINVAGTRISPNTGNGIEINATGGTATALNVTAPTTIAGGDTGLRLNSATAAIVGNTINNLTFTGQTAKYVVLDSMALNHNIIDATAATFDGLTGATALLSQNFDIEDKINHKIDSDSLGFVLVKANNAYVTPISFITPTTTLPKIQRGVNASSSGFTLHVKAGTYLDNVTVNKSLTILGAQAGQDANARFAAFSGLKAGASETVVTTPTNNPSNGNPNANDLFRVIANNVTIDGFTLDGNNPAFATSTVTDDQGLAIHARRTITNVDSLNNINPVNNLNIRNNILQNVAQRVISLSNNGPVSTGNLITGNVVRNYGWDAGGQAILLTTNAYADVTNNTVTLTPGNTGIHLDNFFGDGTMTWSGNTVTVAQDALGIHANNFYAPNGVVNITGNTVNAASGVTGTTDLTWGINAWSIQNGSTVNINNNIVGSSNDGTFARGINLWNMPTSKTVTVTGGSVANSVVGINLDAVDPYYGAGSPTMAQVNGAKITGTTSGVRVRTSTLATAPYYNPNTVSGSTTIMLSKDTINVSGTAKGVEIVAPAASAPYMATAYLTHGTLVNNTSTSDTAVIINGNQAQLFADTSNIKMGSAGTHDAIQFANITSGNTVSNLVLAGGTTINRNGNLIAKAIASPQFSIVEMSAPAPGWTAPDSTVGGNQSILIDGAMKFTSGNLNAGNSIIEFGSHALDIMNSGTVQQEKAISSILGNARMLTRTVGTGALDMLGVRLVSEPSAATANVGDMTILRTTLTSGSISPAFPNGNSIRTTWAITPTNTTSSRSDVEYRYLGTNENLNGQTPSSIYAYRYTGGQWNKVSATLSSAQSGNVYTTASFGVPGFSPWTLSSQSTLDAPDLTPVITVLPPSFTPATTTEPLNIKLFNIGTVATAGTGPITVFVLKPSTAFTNITLSNDAITGTGGWTIADNGAFYTLTSTTSPVIASGGFISITGSVNTIPGIPAGRYTVSASIANNSGGETNNANNSASTVINVSN